MERIRQAIFSCTLLAAVAHAQQIDIDRSRIVQPIVAETNAYRSSVDAVPVTPSPLLMQAAQQYADYLARTNSTGHAADGRNVMQRISATSGYRPCFAAENVFDYWSQPDVAEPSAVVQAAMKGWKKSAGHDANLRHQRAQQIGVGVAAWTHEGRHYYKVVQVFGAECGERGRRSAG